MICPIGENLFGHHSGKLPCPIDEGALVKTIRAKPARMVFSFGPHSGIRAPFGHSGATQANDPRSKPSCARNGSDLGPSRGRHRSGTEANAKPFRTAAAAKLPPVARCTVRRLLPQWPALAQERPYSVSCGVTADPGYCNARSWTICVACFGIPCCYEARGGSPPTFYRVQKMTVTAASERSVNQCETLYYNVCIGAARERRMNGIKTNWLEHRQLHAKHLPPHSTVGIYEFSLQFRG
jgi:hypothetical protein